jgi:hypothetical protein
MIQLKILDYSQKIQLEGKWLDGERMMNGGNNRKKIKLEKKLLKKE